MCGMQICFDSPSTNSKNEYYLTTSSVQSLCVDNIHPCYETIAEAQNYFASALISYVTQLPDRLQLLRMILVEEQSMIIRQAVACILDLPW